MFVKGYNMPMSVDNLKDILKKLEGVYKISSDVKQKERVKLDIEKLRVQIKELEEYGEEEVLEPEDDQEELVSEVKEKSEVEKQNTILSKFPVKKIHKISKDNEVNAAATYVDVFETELLGALSEFHLKLDYYHSKERDKYYNSFENLKRLIKQYIDILEELFHATVSAYIEKLKLMKNKHNRALLIDSVKFMNDMSTFLNKIIKDYDSKGNIILNPHEKLCFSNIEGKKMLHQWEIIVALRYIRDFGWEFIKAINLPDEIIKINN